MTVSGRATTMPAHTTPEVTSLRHTQRLVCSNCHNALTADTGKGTAIAFSHEKHLNRNYHCNQCHKSLAHGDRISPSHPECFACHDGKTASRDCEFCHLQRADINPHAPNFIRVHGREALRGPAGCRTCHIESFCRNCHTLQVPHPPNWARTHGQRVGDGACFRCHTREYCNQCHRRTQPLSHSRRDWLQLHGQASLRLGGNCGLCHTRQFCIDCHGLSMPHPSDWTSAHARPRKTQTEVCQRCHAVEECQTCHIRRRILGHPAQFVVGHGEAIRRQDSDCRICHALSFCQRCHPQMTGRNGDPETAEGNT